MSGKDMLGPYSVVYVKTLPGYPSQVRSSHVVELESDTASIAWDEPALWNGETKRYKIDVIESNHLNTQVFYSNKTEFKIEGLLGYTNYTANIYACNPKCSNISNAISFKTKVGIPGKIIKVQDQSSSSNHYEWEEPEDKEGEIAFYEYRIQWISNNDMQQVEGATYLKRCILMQDLCSLEINYFSFLVRAVNTVERKTKLPINSTSLATQSNSFNITCKDALNDNKLKEICESSEVCLRGPWTEISQQYCQYVLEVWQLLIVSFIVIIVIISLIYLTFKIKICVKVPKAELPLSLHSIYQDNGEESQIFQKRKIKKAMPPHDSNERIYFKPATPNGSYEHLNVSNNETGKVELKFVATPFISIQDNNGIRT